jgi:ABC-2 type transport system ATP-binding protein
VGLLPPDGGTARVAGVDVWRDRVGAVRNLGYVPDRPNVYPWMRVEQAVEFAAKMWSVRPAGGVGGAWNAALAAKLQKQYGLDGRQKCGKLSKGQGAKLSLLLALSHEPAVLILDEPTDGLDPIAREEFLQQVLESTLQQERAAERTVLISSHALGDLQRLTDTVAVLHEGSLLVHAPTEELVTGTKRLRVVLDRPTPESGGLPAVPAGAIFHQRRGREWTITLSAGGGAGGAGSEEAARALRGMPGVSAVSVEDLSLDEVFKDLVRGRTPATAQHDHADDEGHPSDTLAAAAGGGAAGCADGGVGARHRDREARGVSRGVARAERVRVVWGRSVAVGGVGDRSSGVCEGASRADI